VLIDDAVHREVHRPVHKFVPATLACLLAATSGSVDALSYFHLGGAFSSAMTGNLALLGISIGGLRPGLLTRVVIAVLAYGVGIVMAAYFTRRVPDRNSVWPTEVTRAFTAAIAPFAVAAALLLADGTPKAGAQLPVLALLALAMGMQSGAYRFVRISGVLGTTYVSGNVVVLFTSLARGQADWTGLLSLLAVAAGAASEIVVVRAAPSVAGILPLLLIGFVAVVAGTARFRAALPSGSVPGTGDQTSGVAA
jgi:uncharacterized membrane protein YoaK (UPF0700 family)